VISSLKQRKPRLLIRKVVGESMLPTLKPGEIVVAIRNNNPKVGRIVLVKHQGIEKVKRISDIKDNKVYLLGDNSKSSTDSRDFGYIDMECILGTVIWPFELSTGVL